MLQSILIRLLSNIVDCCRISMQVLIFEFLQYMYFSSPFANDTWMAVLVMCALFAGIYWATRPLRKRYQIGSYHLEFQRILFIAFASFLTLIYDANLRAIFAGSGQAPLPFRTVAELARKIRLRSARLIVDSNEDFKMELLNSSKNQEFMELQRTLLSYCRYSKICTYTVIYKLLLTKNLNIYARSLRRACQRTSISLLKPKSYLTCFKKLIDHKFL